MLTRLSESVHVTIQDDDDGGASLNDGSLSRKRVNRRVSDREGRRCPSVLLSVVEMASSFLFYFLFKKIFDMQFVFSSKEDHQSSQLLKGISNWIDI